MYVYVHVCFLFFKIFIISVTQNSRVDFIALTEKAIHKSYRAKHKLIVYEERK